ncbi:SAV_2336 N-terminal domain-related protein [Aquincola sp. J276]|uniref:SAV_2336 N-terminal domain-related protein n=1 Tax=Aquincola sp. J276 TaxID=2898432 RepID=UPI002150DB41|nr:SAV_2336 N-terminal domain-related protein [Aquincola sp. J276]MCR5865553.1 hypothetical protein [Aquincola sp. J276]
MVRPTTPSAGPLPEALARLTAAGLAEDLEQLLDALWLACHLPAPAPAEAPQPADRPDTTLAAPALAQSPRTGPPPEPGRNGAPEVEVALQRAAADLPPAAQGLYAHAGPGPAEDDVRARALRVAGVPALRDGPALARALRPLGKRRPSRTRFVLDEAATAEHFADTGLLMPMLVGERERFLAATLLVEDSPALPLWRGLADELEALLARQGGFRSFRRLALASVDGRLHLRSRSGALHPPRMLLEDDASLVLIATDGTPSAWSDGRMAALATELGRRTALAVLQWMPERLWPHTALGSADLGVQSPRPGAPLAELRVQRPRWLGRHEPVLPMPVAALTPAALGRLAAMLMAKPGARSPAGLLWLAPPADDEAPADEPDEALDDLTPAQRIARFRGMASARLLQAAVQLSAAAPLTLPVVRLVHRVMQPGAPAEDLPLLLLGGLLERQPRPAGTAAPSGHKDDDNDVTFDFAPGVRQALQASLLKHEADAVRRAVSSYIAERQGSPVDFTALLLDPEGALRLPAWARPFAEVNRQLQALFAPPPSAAEPPPLRLRERAWAPGVTVQAEVALGKPALQIAWSPDGRRLAVRHARGVVVFKAVVQPSGRRRLVQEPLAMRGRVQMMVVRGPGIGDAAFEAWVSALRQRWTQWFRSTLDLRFHTLDLQAEAPAKRRGPPRLRQLVSLVQERRQVVCAVGTAAPGEGAWLQRLKTQFEQGLPPAEHHRLLAAIADAEVHDTLQAADWTVQSLTSALPLAERMQADIDEAATAVLASLALLGADALEDIGFDAQATDLAWLPDGRLLVMDAGRRAVVREADLQVHEAWPAHWAQAPDGTRVVARHELLVERQRTPVMAVEPDGGQVALAWRQDLQVALPGYASMQLSADAVEAPITALAWAWDGAHLAMRLANGTVRFLWATEKPSMEMKDLHGVARGPAWAQRSPLLAVAMGDGGLRVQGLQEPVAQWTTPDEVTDISWSHDDRLLACALHSGGLQLAHGLDAGHRPRLVEVQPPGGGAGPARAAFAPVVLDAGYEALAVADGPVLRLLRIDSAALQESPAAAAHRMPPAAPSSSDLDRPPEDTLPEPDEVVAAACTVLHALAQAFHAGAMAPGTQPVSERYAHRLGLRSGMPGRATLEVLVALSREVIGGPVREALEGGADPLAQPDTEAAGARWRGSVEQIDAALQALLPGEVPDAADSRGAISLMQQWLLLLEAVLDDLSEADRAALDEALGFPAAGWLASLAPLREPVIRTFGDALRRRLPMLQSLHGSLPALRADDVVELLAPSVARTTWLHAEHGHSVFSGCRRLDDFAARFTGSLAQACDSLLDGAPPTPPLRVEVPVPVAELAVAAGLAAPLDLQLMPDAGSGATATWALHPADVAPTVRLLGAIVASRLAWQRGLPPPEDWAVPGLLLLWVDDRPANNSSAVQELRRRGFRVRTALDTDSALALLESGLPVQAVISDMGRPPDEQAGYTLLDEMRHRGHSQPFLIFSRAPPLSTRRKPFAAARLAPPTTSR